MKGIRIKIETAELFGTMKFIALRSYESSVGFGVLLLSALSPVLMALRSWLDSRTLSRVLPFFVLGNTVSLFHNEKGALFHLVIDPREVFAQQPDSD